MQLIDLPLDQIVPATWNPNEMDCGMMAHLRRSIERFGLLVPLVVRSVGPNQYETIGGAQRRAVLRELGIASAPCVIVQADDAQARLLSQALNHIAGFDNAGLRGELLRHVLQATPEQDILALLPDSFEELRALASMGQADLAQHLQAWQQAQGARLHHLQLQLTGEQLPLVEQALRKALPQAKEARGDNPNLRGSAFTVICRHYLHCRRGRP